MYYDEKKLHELAELSNELTARFRGKGAELKKAVDTEKEYTAVWSDMFREPYDADYITDLEEICPRKILKSVPRKTSGKAKFFYDNGSPVYCIFYDEKGAPMQEGFFVNEGNNSFGIFYSAASGMLLEITAETKGDNGLPEQFIRIDLCRERDHYLDCRVYEWEDGHLISAERIDRFYFRQEIMMYNDKRYENWAKRDIDYILNTPPMNPYMVNSYSFIYGSSRYAEQFSRTDYSYCTEGRGQWKMTLKLMEKLDSYGIKAFIKQLQ